MTTEKDKETWPLSIHDNDRMVKYGAPGTYRDMLGYGPSAVAVKWPKGAKVALNFVINYEEGGEECVLHGDTGVERNLSSESKYDYGSRAGFWRLHRLFSKKKTPATVFAVGMALERNPAVCHALRDQSNWEVASHGYREMDYTGMDEELENEHLQRCIQIHEQLIGKRPVGIYFGKPNEKSRRFVVEEGGFKYDSDSYADDLPYWNMDFDGKLHLVIPYTMTETDMRFTQPNGYPNAEAFAKDLKDTLRYLVEEGRGGHAKMMTVALHCRLARPGRAAAVAEFLDFARSYGRDVWICTREEIADFWMEHHFPKGAGSPMRTGVDSPTRSPARKKPAGDLLVDFKDPDDVKEDEDEDDTAEGGTATETNDEEAEEEEEEDLGDGDII